MKAVRASSSREIYNHGAFFSNSPWNSALGGEKSNVPLTPDGQQAAEIFFLLSFCASRRVGLDFSELSQGGSGNITGTGSFLSSLDDLLGTEGVLLLSLPWGVTHIRCFWGGNVSAQNNVAGGIRSNREICADLKCFMAKNLIWPSRNWILRTQWSPASLACNRAFSSCLDFSVCTQSLVP